MLEFLSHQKIFYKTCMRAVKVAMNFQMILKRWTYFGTKGCRISHRGSETLPEPSPADVGVDQIRNKKLQIHACAHKRVSVFTVINPHHWKRPFSSDGLGEAFDRLRARWDRSNIWEGIEGIVEKSTRQGLLSILYKLIASMRHTESYH